ncbi:hypothetical protein [Nocardia tengchongensis]|uniref:hypothetical protein n=1 Tax=Nocardia tengchongensis TaxID=2055889 RepID=UPI003680E714
MSIEDVLALLDEGVPAGWVCFQDGSWAPVGPDGRVGPPITPIDLLAAAHQDLAALQAAGLIAEVVDAEPHRSHDGWL